MKKAQRENVNKMRRLARTRTRITGTAKKPRINVFRSNTNMYVQFIDDISGKTIVSGSMSQIKEVPKKEGVTARVAKAFALGLSLAKKAKEAGINEAVFDRGLYAYHGRVKAIAEGAREGGLKF